MLADAFEAVIGALYLDQGLSAVRDMLEPILVDEIDRILNDQSDRDAKSRLQEWSQATRNITPHYRTIKETGPDHAKWFTVEVYLGTEAAGQGNGPSKQLAAQAAAADALKKLEAGS